MSRDVDLEHVFKIIYRVREAKTNEFIYASNDLICLQNRIYIKNLAQAYYQNQTQIRQLIMIFRWSSSL